MNPRERMLAIVVGTVGLFIVAFFAQSWVSGQFGRRNAEITRLQGDIRKFKREIALGQRAARTLADYEKRSLPSNPEIARTRYQFWLLGAMEAAELSEPNVHFQGMQADKDLLVKQTFLVDARGTLPQVVDLLHSFYRVDWLHRITRLSLRPVKDSKELDLTMHIEALSLKKAVSSDQLEAIPSERLALKDIDSYFEVIVGRNVFGPRNNDPSITISGLREVFVNRDADLTVQGTDPDPLDVVYYEMIESASPDAKLDPVTGKFTWRPKEPGTYEFLVEGYDDGFPARASKQEKIVITVKEQPPPAPKAPEFDFAKLTELTALLEVNGQGEVWLNVRPLGRIVVLHQGDQFVIGSIKGTVSAIGEYDFSFDSEGKRRKLAKGEFLDQAKVTEELPVASPAAGANPPGANPAAETLEVGTKPTADAKAG